jgi:D-alanyl-lipoteichoic acid acyltransferase DltB (MBOAT superfamily)
MNFNRESFAIFFAVVLALHSLNLPWKLRKFNLLIFSYIFYAAWKPEFVLLIVFSTIVDWFAARKMYYSESKAVRNAWLGVSLVANFGLLSYFKYGQFLFDNYGYLLSWLGEHHSQVNLGITLPVGISFYTFQTLSYSIDAYRRTSEPWHSFLDYALYVTFFPQLVAGPIVRSSDFLPQCVEPKRANISQFSWGLALMLLGLFEKVVLADVLLAPLTEKAFSGAVPTDFMQAWTGVLSFAMQIFGDFAGYSTTAIGIALCLGFTFQDNFRFPYAAVGFSDFWQRWHISLSSWLRDYLYISLGGNRKGTFRTYYHLMVTMLLGGLWHGADWKFVAWGGLHGVFLIIERFAKRLVGHWNIWRSNLMRLLLMLITFGCICLTWVFFRANDFMSACNYVKALLCVNCASPSASNVGYIKPIEQGLVIGIAMAMLTLHWILRDTTLEDAAKRVPWWIRAIILSGMMIAIVTMTGDDRAFIYFQF